MATTTTNYSLTKPAYNDTVDIAVINNNFDTIDSNLKSVSDTATDAKSKAESANSKADAAQSSISTQSTNIESLQALSLSLVNGIVCQTYNS